ncbi:MAG TPA: TAXI family TRAP transporter solute-binding subunit [Candidatus Acidoferrum sp.]|nr:TAXI family TRAP transporter solute-binding subunit [Candidatus Acidoferrum sp.]
MKEESDKHSSRLLTPLEENFGLNPKIALAVVLCSAALLASTVFWFFYSAPPTTITITSGPAGSSFETNAIQYAKILARNGVTLKILPSEGSTENLERLNDRSTKVDVGFVLVGPASDNTNGNLMSLGSIAYQPLLIFYRAEVPISFLSELKGKRLAIGAQGSGARSLALSLLGLNGVGTNDTTSLLDLDATAAANALLNGTLDAVFLMGDSASPQIMKRLLLTPDIRLFNFTQADGYTRRIAYLNKLEIPMGSIDFGKNIPPQDVYLVGPTVEIIARPDLHPALSDLLLEAAQEVHGGAKLLQRKGEFPAPLAYNFRISPDANRFYKSGKKILYRSLPFWLASLLNRILVSFIPLIVVSVPLVRAVPALYKWRMRLLIYRRYRALLSLERESLVPITSQQRTEMLARLEEIEHAVNKMRVPASFADQFYFLRGHINFVRIRLADGSPPARSTGH